MSQSTTTLYGFSFSHHGRYSSFYRLLHYSQEHRIIDVVWPLSGFSNKTLASIASKLEWRWRKLAEWRLRPIFLKKERQCVHYLYPENSFFRAGQWKKHHRLVLSCHQPPGHFGAGEAGKNSFFIRALNHADRVVLLAESFRSGYEPFCGKDRLRVIPHGVDVDFFSPPQPTQRKPLVVTVGNWLRDYEFWADGILRFAAQRPEMQFAVIAMPGVAGASFSRVRAQLGERVRLLRNLNDEDLRTVYREASLLFLPLKDAGANNALLEAMACGLPSLVTDLPATREYAGDTAAYFSPGNLDECVTQLGRLLDNAEHRTILSASARERAIQCFAWEVIAAKYRQLYSEVLEE